MLIGIYHVAAPTASGDLGYRCAQALVASARRTMPRVRVVHFTDLRSPAIKGVDDVRRKPPEPMALLRMRHQASVEGEWLFVDTDVWFQRSVTRVFLKPFDIGITTREWSHLRVASGFSERMPYNTGVVFSRCPHFWAEAYTRLRHADRDVQQWMGDQEVIGDMLTEDWSPYQVCYLKGSTYNFPPHVDTIDEARAEAVGMQNSAAIVHYKGPARKALLLDRIKREGRRCA